MKPLTLPLLVLFLSAYAFAADSSSSNVKLDTTMAKPRAIEDLTRNALARDYGNAWLSLTDASESGSPKPLDAYFVGSARKDLGDAVESQRNHGLQSRFLSQEHNLQAVFYAPEGDVVELHDTAHCQVQILDGNKVLDDRGVVLHFVVLMTPGADRWVIRQLQAVPAF
ncbi:MAG TPA: hypothetical protein VJQ82_26710 [Terriglobales bacterium]|nr:hypothetical protein [Terriglobales bacterium]